MTTHVGQLAWVTSLSQAISQTLSGTCFNLLCEDDMLSFLTRSLIFFATQPQGIWEILGRNVPRTCNQWPAGLLC
jgi:hypothetical protein